MWEQPTKEEAFLRRRPLSPCADLNLVNLQDGSWGYLTKSSVNPRSGFQWHGSWIHDYDVGDEDGYVGIWGIWRGSFLGVTDACAGVILTSVLPPPALVPVPPPVRIVGSMLQSFRRTPGPGSPSTTGISTRCGGGGSTGGSSQSQSGFERQARRPC